MAKLIFDIETIGENFDEMDAVTQHDLTRWIEREANTQEEHEKMLQDYKKGLSFSALTGEIVSIGVWDYEKDKGTVYFQAPGQNIGEIEEDRVKFKQMTEEEMINNFWKGASHYQEFISFNGRSFDVPFLVIRSAVYGIKPTKDLMSNRYLNSQRPSAQHIDLLDQFSFYGASRRKGSMHLWCRVFGIESSKSHGITGEDVQELFKQGRFLDIAKYNASDLTATKKLYEKWENYFKF